MSILDIFKRKPSPEKLEKAKMLGLITNEEFLKMKIWRLEKELKKLKDPKQRRGT